MAAPSLPPLKPLKVIDRPLTGPEYYHACVGRHPRSVLKPRDVVAVLEGRLEDGANIDWQSALDQVSDANPGCRLRLHGLRQHAHWRSDGPAPRVRFLPDCNWEGRSSDGDEFIYATPLCLETGPVCELIITGRQTLKVIFRAAHAVMDGSGVLHCLHELFRAVRGEPLLGSNASYTDVELMRHLRPQKQKIRFVKPTPLVGPARGMEKGGQWRRISLPAPQPSLLPRILQFVAEYARRHADPADPVRIALPVSLKRHAPDLLTTCNFTNMLYLDIAPQADVDSIKNQLKSLLEQNVDAHYPDILEAIRYLPFSWLDRLLSPNDKNYTRPRLAETALFSMMGPLKRAPFRAPGLQIETVFGIPQKESAFILGVSFQGQIEISVAMSNVFASEGRLDAFVHELQQKLIGSLENQTDSGPPLTV